MVVAMADMDMTSELSATGRNAREALSGQELPCVSQCAERTVGPRLPFRSRHNGEEAAQEQRHEGVGRTVNIRAGVVCIFSQSSVEETRADVCSETLCSRRSDLGVSSSFIGARLRPPTVPKQGSRMST
jgi:hypothetical protein